MRLGPAIAFGALCILASCRGSLVRGGDDIALDDADTGAPTAVHVSYYGYGGDDGYERSLVLSIWESGVVVASDDRVYGGPPYRTTTVPRNVAIAALRRIRRLVHSIPDSDRQHLGAHSGFGEISLSSGGAVEVLSSWHEVAESCGFMSAAEHGTVTAMPWEHSAVLRGSSPDYRRFRSAWRAVRDIGNYLASLDVPASEPTAKSAAPFE